MRDHLSGFDLALRQLLGRPLPALPLVPGRVIRAYDEPLTAADLADVDSPAELGRLLGITRQAAFQRLKSLRQSTQPIHEGTTP